MKNCLRLWLIACLIGCTKSAVHFKNSLILDEFDISGHDSVSLDAICKENGCKIYVSSVENADFIDNLAFKAGNDEEIAVTNTTYYYEDKTQQKIPFLVEKGDSISIINTNENLACGPIVVYAISNVAPNFDVAGVYDVAQNYRQEQAVGKIVTVMGPTPFTVWASSPSEKMEASVFTTGFDIEDSEKCSEVYHSIRGQSIKYAVNGPITTLFFKEEVQMNVDYLEFYQNEKVDLTSATFFTSPGYIGCANGEVYHSSRYNSDVKYSLWTDVARSTRLEALLNTHDPLTLRINENPDMERSFTGSIADDSYSRSGEISAMELSFSYTMTDSDASFLVKFTDLGITVTENTRRTPPPTTPSSPRPTTSRTSSTTTSPTTTTATPTTSGAMGTSIASGLALLMMVLFV